MNRKRVCGITLLELLIVLTIISILSGLGLAGYYSLKNRSMREASLVEASLKLRQARNYAVSGSVGSIVEVDPVEGVMRSWSYQPVWLLGFEGIVVLAEAALLYLACRGRFFSARTKWSPLSVRQAAWVSLLANAVSAGVSLLVPVALLSIMR